MITNNLEKCEISKVNLDLLIFLKLHKFCPPFLTPQISFITSFRSHFKVYLLLPFFHAVITTYWQVLCQLPVTRSLLKLNCERDDFNYKNIFLCFSSKHRNQKNHLEQCKAQYANPSSPVPVEIFTSQVNTSSGLLVRTYQPESLQAGMS